MIYHNQSTHLHQHIQLLLKMLRPRLQMEHLEYALTFASNVLPLPVGPISAILLFANSTSSILLLELIRL